MTDHTYCGYTAEQIRAAAEAATPGKWRAPEGANEIVAWVEIPIGGALHCGSIHCDHSLPNAHHVATSQPATMLALLDRIAELENDAKRMDYLSRMADMGFGIAPTAAHPSLRSITDYMIEQTEWPEDRGEHPQQGLAK